DGGDEAKPLVSYRDTILADKPVAYWRLGEATLVGQAADEVGSVPGKYEPGLTPGVPGATGDGNTAVKFGSAVATFEDSFDFSGHAFSVELWVLPAPS